MTEIEGAFGPVSGRFKTSAPIIRDLKPCTPAIKIKTRLLRPDDMVSFHADHEGNVSATRVHVAEGGRLERS